MDRIYSDIEQWVDLKISKESLLQTDKSYSKQEIRARATICWIKDDQGRMIAISGGYEKHIGITQEEYEGKLDSEVHGDLGLVFERNDRIVRETLIAVTRDEKWLNPEGQLMTGEVLKKPHLYNGRWGTFGYIFQETIRPIYVST